MFLLINFSFSGSIAQSLTTEQESAVKKLLKFEERIEGKKKCNKLNSYVNKNLKGDPEVKTSFSKSFNYLQLRKSIHCASWKHAANYYVLALDAPSDIKNSIFSTLDEDIENKKGLVYKGHFRKLKDALKISKPKEIETELGKCNKRFDPYTFTISTIYISYLRRKGLSLNERKREGFKAENEILNSLMDLDVSMNENHVWLFEGVFSNKKGLSTMINELIKKGPEVNSKTCSEIASGVVSKQSGRINEVELVAALSKENTDKRKQCILEQVNRLICQKGLDTRTVPSVSIVISDYGPGEVYNQKAIQYIYEFIETLKKYELEHPDRLTGVKVIGTADNSAIEKASDYDGFLGVFDGVACPSCRSGKMTFALGDQVDNDELAFLRAIYARNGIATAWPQLVVNGSLSVDIRQYETTGGAKRSIEIQITCSNLKQLSDFLEAEMEQTNSFSIYYNEQGEVVSETTEVASE